MTYRGRIYHLHGALRRGDLRRLHTHQVRPRDPPISSTPAATRPALRPPLGDYYAACIQENLPEGVTCLFGPATGHPAGRSRFLLYRNWYDRDLPYCFQPQGGQGPRRGRLHGGLQAPGRGRRGHRGGRGHRRYRRAGSPSRLFKHVAKVNMKALIVSVDRMGGAPRTLYSG